MGPRRARERRQRPAAIRYAQLAARAPTRLRCAAARAAPGATRRRSALPRGSSARSASAQAAIGTTASVASGFMASAPTRSRSSRRQAARVPPQVRQGRPVSELEVADDAAQVERAQGRRTPRRPPPPPRPAPRPAETRPRTARSERPRRGAIAVDGRRSSQPTPRSGRPAGRCAPAQQQQSSTSGSSTAAAAFVPGDPVHRPEPDDRQRPRPRPAPTNGPQSGTQRDQRSPPSRRRRHGTSPRSRAARPDRSISAQVVERRADDQPPTARPNGPPRSAAGRGPGPPCSIATRALELGAQPEVRRLAADDRLEDRVVERRRHEARRSASDHGVRQRPAQRRPHGRIRRKKSRRARAGPARSCRRARSRSPGAPVRPRGCPVAAAASAASAGGGSGTAGRRLGRPQGGAVGRRVEALDRSDRSAGRTTRGGIRERLAAAGHKAAWRPYSTSPCARVTIETVEHVARLARLSLTARSA